MNAFKKYFDNDNYQNGLRTVLICALAVTLVVSINLFTGLIPTKIANLDISTGRVYSIAGDTEDSLKALEKPVHMLYVCETGEENHNTEVMLNLYADASDKVTVERVDPAYDPTTVIKYTGETAIDNNTVIVTSGDRQQIVNYKDYYSGGSFVLEDYLNSAVNYVTGDELNVAYFAEGHGEAEVDDSTIAYLGLDGFDYKTISIMDEGSIPSDCRVLVINGLKKDLTAKEADIILAYLKQGGGLVLTNDYSKESFANLNKVTGYFEAQSGDGVIMESDSNRYTNDNPAYVVPYLYTDNKVLSDGVNYLILPNLSPIVIDEENLDPSISFTKLLEASDKSLAVYTNILTGKGETTPGPFTVGALLEKGENGSEGRMIWITSKFISNSAMSEAAGGGNLTFFLNSISYLGKNEPVASIHGKTISTQFLDLTTSQVKLWEIIIPGVIPAIALIIGVIVVIRRKRR
ncbi:MAG: Gldg family protein [Firmicutes bacterium]|nr:Gldg family protein [Bacillota bacterium]